MTLTEFLHPLRKSSRKEQALAALYFLKHFRGQADASPGDVKQVLIDASIPGARKTNVSAALGSAAPRAGRGDSRGSWSITPTGEAHVRKQLALPTEQPQAQHDVQQLEKLAAKIEDATVRDYIEESIKCLKVDARRAAVVFLWSGAVATIRAAVWAKARSPKVIDAALKKHNPSARNFKRRADFDYVNDAALLEITVDLAVLDRSEKKQLKQALDLRNDCGHPVKYRPGEKKVSSFIEDVITIVFT